MTASPKLNSSNVQYVLNTAELILHNTKSRRTGSQGEQQTQTILMNELKKYCDDTSQHPFKTHPGAGTLVEKLLCMLLIVCVLLFSISVGNGYVAPASISLVISLAVFCAFTYKIIFDGKKLDFITPAKKSKNLLGVRYAANTPKSRIVLVARSDAPQSMRTYVFGNRAPFILSICALIGNTVLFSSQMLFLFAGAPEDSVFFEIVRALCFIFIPFYTAAIFLVDNRKTATGISSSIIPSAILLSIMKQFYENSFRYEKTEVCCLITGSDYSSHAGAYAFAKKYKRIYRDIPTVFIPVEEITSSENLAVFFRDGSGTKGSAEVASVIGEAADNLGLTLNKENFILGTSSFSPFSKEQFSACSLGTSKKHTSKSLSASTDRLSAVSKKAISDVGELIIETMNYYDG